MIAPATLSEQRVLLACRLGLVPYQQTWDLQRRLHAERVEGTRPDTLLLLQHPPVYTLGRNAAEEHILVPAEELSRRGATVVRIDRGGEVTYHGPGQLVAYPIIKLEGDERSIALLVHNLEQAIIDTLGAFGIPGERLADQRGVWTCGCKIASVGLAVKKWAAMHGMALNVAMDMSYFALINPCGHPETVMTSMEQQLGHAPTIDDVATEFARTFAGLFGRRLAWDSLAEPTLEAVGSAVR
jgi:lipoate-protein ligase B